MECEEKWNEAFLRTFSSLIPVLLFYATLANGLHHLQKADAPISTLL